MRLFVFSAPLAWSAIAATASAVRRDDNSYCGYCISQHAANKVIERYSDILMHVNSDLGTPAQTAQLILGDNFTETSDSILSLEGRPLGGPTVVGKQAYINETLSGPVLGGIETIDVLVSCPDKIVWYWNFKGVGDAEYEVKGFNLFDTSAGSNGVGLVLDDTFIEFNSIAWGLDAGYTITFPSGGPTGKRLLRRRSVRHE